MSEKHLPKWLRSKSREMATAGAVASIGKFPGTFGDLAGVIAVHMGTATQAEVDAYKAKREAEILKSCEGIDLASFGDVDKTRDDYPEDTRTPEEVAADEIADAIEEQRVQGLRDADRSKRERCW